MSIQNPSLSQPAIFRDGHLSLGVTLPVRQAEESTIDFTEQVELATVAEQLGLSAVWVRDVPLNGPWYPEAFGHPDPVVMLGAIASRTSRISLGTAATVLGCAIHFTSRKPLFRSTISAMDVSCSASALAIGAGNSRLSARIQRLIRRLYREHWAQLAAALERPPRILLPSSDPATAFELRPAAATGIPMLAVGSGGQTLEWIARNAAGWATYHRPPQVQRDRHMLWRRAVDRAALGQFRSFTVALRIELLGDSHAPASPIDLGYRTGTRQLLEILKAMRDDGVHHVMLTLLPTGVLPREKLAGIADLVKHL